MNAVEARRAARWGAGFAVLPVLLALALPAAGTEGTVGEPRTDAGGLSGYVVGGAGAPLTVLLFEPLWPVPVNPGEPNLELASTYSRATLTTGPVARALASTAWPGPLVGDGMEGIVEHEPYPVKADARYPQGPAEDARELPGGSGMTASARGLDVVAEATATRASGDVLVRLGTVTSISTATVAQGSARTTALAAVSDVVLLGGLVAFGSVRTELEATSDGGTAATAGFTEVTGLEIAGHGFTLDEEGPRPVEDGAAAPGPLPVPTALPGAEELRAALGVGVELLPQVEAVDGADATRSAGGVRVTIDTTTLRQALEVLPVAELVGALPDDLQAELYPLLTLSPRIVYIFGHASVRAAGSQPFDIGAPGLPPPPPDSPPDLGPADGAAFHDDRPATADLQALPAPGIATDAFVEAAALPLPAPAAATVGGTLPPPFEGLPAGAVGLAVVLAALAAHGLARLRALALAGAGAACSSGAPHGLPNLRGDQP